MRWEAVVAIIGAVIGAMIMALKAAYEVGQIRNEIKSSNDALDGRLQQTDEMLDLFIAENRSFRAETKASLSKLHIRVDRVKEELGGRDGIRERLTRIEAQNNGSK